MGPKTGHPQALTNRESFSTPDPAAAGPAPGATPPHAPAAGGIAAVIPCFNRPADLAALLADLFDEAAGLGGLRGPGAFSVIVVDNASDPPLGAVVEPLRARWASAGLALGLLRLEANLGGSGGFNAGMRAALARPPEDAPWALWLLDSDARLEPGALRHLLAALGHDPALAAVGSALADPDTGEVFEVGGRINRRTGEFEQPLPPGWESRPVIDAEYAAACSILVR
ncbi:MAG: glycosyltransferase, partial [Phycisphaerales bacterium]